MKYGLLTYHEHLNKFNLGDYIQSLAAKQFLPQVDYYINREMLGAFKGDKTKIILNGWFTHKPLQWVPSESVIPLFVSFHMNTKVASRMLSREGIEYLKKHEPIGCRDKYTEQILKDNGIDAYFTGCLTLTLDSYKVPESERTNDVFIVDPLYNYPDVNTLPYEYKHIIKSVLNLNIFKLRKSAALKTMIDEKILKEAKYETHILPAKKYTEKQKFEIAEALLKKYARAKLVITSRIHCALPSLALGTPVIYINGFDNFADSCRFDGITDLFNRIDIVNGEVSNNFGLKGKITRDTIVTNSDKYKDLAFPLKETCNLFIKS